MNGPGNRLDHPALHRRWKVQPDDEIGGWCVTLDVPGTPATGNRPLMSFVSEAVARYVVSLHHKVIGPDLGSIAEVMQEHAARTGQQVRLTVFDRGTGDVTRVEADPPRGNIVPRHQPELGPELPDERTYDDG